MQFTDDTTSLKKALIMAYRYSRRRGGDVDESPDMKQSIPESVALCQGNLYRNSWKGR